MFTSKTSKLSLIAAAACCLLFSPTASADKYCNLERSLKSPTSVIKMPIEFINRSSYPRYVYWLNFDGKRDKDRRQIIDPGDKWEQSSYVGHLWVASRSTKCIGIYAVDPQLRKVYLW